jgi:hypothetical protein
MKSSGINDKRCLIEVVQQTQPVVVTADTVKSISLHREKIKKTLSTTFDKQKNILI